MLSSYERPAVKKSKNCIAIALHFAHENIHLTFHTRGTGIAFYSGVATG